MCDTFDLFCDLHTGNEMKWNLLYDLILLLISN